MTPYEIACVSVSVFEDVADAIIFLDAAQMKSDEFHGTVIVTRIPPYQLPDSNRNKRPVFLLPGSEIKGTLSDTFEMETIDAEFLPVDEVPQNLNKE